MFGAFSPVNGDKLLLEMPNCNTKCFEVFLQELSKQDDDEFKFLFPDYVAFHKARHLSIPTKYRIVLYTILFSRTKSSIESMAFIKKKITNRAFKTLKELQDFLSSVIKGKRKQGRNNKNLT